MHYKKFSLKVHKVIVEDKLGNKWCRLQNLEPWGRKSGVIPRRLTCTSGELSTVCILLALLRVRNKEIHIILLYFLFTNGPTTCGVSV